MAVALSLPQITLPRMIIIAKEDHECVKYESEKSLYWDKDGSVFDLEAKIVIERAKSDDSLVHLRFPYINRYWARDDNGWIVANSKDPEEDQSNPSCTLFNITPADRDGWISIKHVQSGGYVTTTDTTTRIRVSDTPADWYYTDWETIVIVPNHVAFKANNSMYLQSVWAADHPFLQFQTDDPNQEITQFQIHPQPSGFFRIKSIYFDKFWRRGNNWIWADEGDDNITTDSYFWPVKIDNNTIALRNQGNDQYCEPLSEEGFTNCMNAHSKTITEKGKLTVKELVLDRQVYNVSYQMDDARIYNRMPFLAGSTTVSNNSDEEGSIAVEIGYEDQRSYSFSRSLSITAGVTATIEADVLEIVKESIQVSYSLTGGFEWNNTTTTTKSVKATGGVPVPGKSKAVVNYVGTLGACDVPFRYTQRSTRSTDGQPLITDEVDGIFTGVNYYDFQFVIEKIEPL